MTSLTLVASVACGDDGGAETPASPSMLEDIAPPPAPAGDDAATLDLDANAGDGAVSSPSGADAPEPGDDASSEDELADELAVDPGAEDAAGGDDVASEGEDPAETPDENVEESSDEADPPQDPPAEEEPAPEEEPADPALGELSFAADVYPIFNDQCLACHGNASWGSNDVNTAFAAASRAANAIAGRVDGSGGAIMPRSCGGGVGQGGCLSQDEVDVIQAWVAAGTPE